MKSYEGNFFSSESQLKVLKCLYDPLNLPEENNVFFSFTRHFLEFIIRQNFVSPEELICSLLLYNM